MGPDFCHLHCHTEYSFLDGATRIKDLLARASTLGQKAVAITDHGNMCGAIEFYKQAKEFNQAAKEQGRQTVKPILGMEAYLTPDGQPCSTREKIEGETAHHLLLWAEDYDGYRNLMKLSSLGFRDGFYRFPRLDWELLDRHHKGVLCSSGCISSQIPFAILRDGYDSAKRWAGRFLEVFGKDNFYFEIQNQTAAVMRNNPSEEAQELDRITRKVNQNILRLAADLGRKVIATNDSHYTSREDAEAHDALLCIGTGKLIRDTNRMKFACSEFYLKSGTEMRELFPDLPEVLTNTLEVAERCNLSIPFGTYHFPNFQIATGEDEVTYFKRLVHEGLGRLYGQPLPCEVKERAEEEIRVLVKMGFVGYLLIVCDITTQARKMGIPVGPGRGSAAGSIVCYALGITNLDPLKYQLIFERFVNEGRNEMPDIDIDFCQARRPEIIQYVQDRYGRDCTAGIITFGTMKAKAAVRDIGRVLDIPLPEVDKIAKLIPGDPTKKITLQPRTDPESGAVHAVDDEPDLKQLYQADPQTRRLVDLARRIEGLSRNPGRHAAGLVIADKDITEYCPLYRDKEGDLLTQYEMNHIDSVGLLKIDFLGLQNLTIIELALRYIKERRGKEIDIDRIPLDDAPTFRMLQRGEAKGVFQFESDGMIKMLMEAQPDRLEDLIALNAMYRPGPLDNIPSFIARKHGREKIVYEVQALSEILSETYGIIVYQEQVMQIANKLGGFSLSDADRLRKAMGKKKGDLMDKFRIQFIEGAAKRSIPKEKAGLIYDLMAKFASYGFNKSHSAAYAYVAYQTAYLKANYTAEYMAALISLNQGNTDDVVMYMEESRRMGLNILGPDVNRSDLHFLVEDDRTLRFSMGGIKGVGEKAVELLVAERKARGPFKDLHDFCDRIDTRSVNKACLESMIRAGAFDPLSGPGGRAQLIAAVEEAMTRGASARRDRESGQGNLFESFGGAEEVSARLPEVAPWDELHKLEEEKKVLGFYLSGHPLADYREFVEGLSSTRSLKALAGIPDGYEVVVGAYINTIQQKITRTKGEKMAVLILEDLLNGSAEAVIFPRAFQQFKDLLQADVIRFLRGKIKHNEGRGISILVDEVLTLEDAIARYLTNLCITLRESELSAPPSTTAQRENAKEPQQGQAAAKAARGATPPTPPPKGTAAAQPRPAAEAARATATHWDAQAASARVQGLTQLLRSHPGKIPVWFQLELDAQAAQATRVVVRAGEKFKVQPSPELFTGLRHLVSPTCLAVTSKDTRAKLPPVPAWKNRAMAEGGRP